MAAQYGVIIASAERALSLAPVIDAAAARYEENFARPARRITVVGSSSVSAAQAQFLRQHGFLNLAWPAPADPTEDVSVLRHELAHIWFNEWYDAGLDKPPNQYASSAPDWLDEIAAILNEDEQSISKRRADLAGALGSGLRLFPLAEFLNMAHPSTSVETARTLNPDNLPSGAITLPDSTVRVPAAPGAAPRIDPNNLPPGAVRMPDGGIFIPADRGTGQSSFTASSQISDPAGRGKMLSFYTQALAFADFLRERTGNPRIIMEIAAATRDRRTFQQWLGSEGRRYGLPSELTSLSTAWEAWLREKTGSALEPAGQAKPAEDTSVELRPGEAKQTTLTSHPSSENPL